MKPGQIFRFITNNAGHQPATVHRGTILHFHINRLVRRQAGDPPTATVVELPRRQRGRQSVQAQADYELQIAQFSALIRQIASTMDFKVGSRGWCYILEKHGLRKGDFDDGEKLITACRKSGALPLDICAEDESRKTVCLEKIDSNNIGEEAQSWFDFLRESAHKTYTPFSFWQDQKVYLEIGVEKIDLLNLFEPVCEEFHVPLTNLKGWSDLNRRAEIMRRFAFWEARGKKIVFLVFTDHDPGGLRIAEKLRKNFEDLSQAVGWRPENLLIIRFGLDADFIDRHKLTWIDNLETSSGQQLDDPEHDDHDKAYVQDYIRRYGVRKCESNALVVEPKLGRALCRRAILRYVPVTAPGGYQHRLERERTRLHREISRRLREGPS
jgi:hypothetical protein